MSKRRSLALIRGSFERAQWALNVSCYEYSVTGLVSKSVSALASVHPQSRMRHGVTPLKLTPPSHNSNNRLTLASTQLHRPRSHILRLTGCHFGTLKDMSSSGRSLDPSALSLNELRKNALLCRRRSLTAVSNPAARTLVLRPHARLCSSWQVSTNAGTAAVKADLMRMSSRRGGRLGRPRCSTLAAAFAPQERVVRDTARQYRVRMIRSILRTCESRVKSPQ